MRKCLIVIISGFVLSFICSCLPTSIYPASNKKDSIIDSTLIGDWKTDHDNSDAIIKIRLTNDSLYSVVMYENKSNSNAMINYLARITKIDSFYIASFETDIDSILKNKYNISHTSMISTYFFIKFKIISNNKISYSLFSFLDMSDPFKKIFNNYNTFAYDKGIKVLTDSTPKVRELLSICLNKNVGFDEEEVMVRIESYK